MYNIKKIMSAQTQQAPTTTEVEISESAYKKIEKDQKKPYVMTEKQKENIEKLKALNAERFQKIRESKLKEAEAIKKPIEEVKKKQEEESKVVVKVKAKRSHKAKPKKLEVVKSESEAESSSSESESESESDSYSDYTTTESDDSSSEDTSSSSSEEVVKRKKGKGKAKPKSKPKSKPKEKKPKVSARELEKKTKMIRKIDEVLDPRARRLNSLMSQMF